MYVFKCFSFKQTNKIPKTPLDLRDTDHWLRACLVFTRGPGFLPQHHKNKMKTRLLLSSVDSGFKDT